MKHTPGPWKINDMSLPSRRVIEIIGEGVPIATVIQHGKGKYYSIKQVEREVAANAKLIAAAPDLLEACKYAFENLEPKGNVKKDFSGHNAMATLSRAIQKATQ